MAALPAVRSVAAYDVIVANERQAKKAKQDKTRTKYLPALPVDEGAGGRERHSMKRWKTWEL